MINRIIELSAQNRMAVFLLMAAAVIGGWYSMQGIPLDAIPDGDAKEYIFGRGTTVFSMFVVRRGREVYGYLNICPHYSSALNYRDGQFMSEDKTHIRCTMHYAEFRIEDGYGVKGAAERCYLDPVPVRVENDKQARSRSVCVRPPAPSPQS